MTLLGPLVDLGEEAPEDLLLHARSLLVDRLDQRVDLLVRLLLVRLESLWDGDGCSGEDFLDSRLGRGVLLAVVVLRVSWSQGRLGTAGSHRGSCVARAWRA